MVSGFKTVRVSGVVLSLGALFALSQGCGKLVGIDETTVGDGGEANGAGTGGGGKGGGAGKASTGGSTSGGASVGGGAGRANATGGGAGRANATGGMGGGSGGMPGSGGTTGGDAGTGTGGSTGGTTGGGAGTSSSGTSGDSGSGGAPSECEANAERCTSSGHEVCADGMWEASPCPLDTPTCEDDACIVRGPTMIGVLDYFIDSTEVTVEQYETFVTAKAGDVSGQVGNCGWNDTYEPGDDPGSPTWPVSYVDWCDADAYCKWADKHLCGRIDRMQLMYEELTLPNDSQWVRACGGPSGSPHPNDNPDCNSNGGGNVKPVGSLAGCEGYYDGIFDMEGNVAEWVDLCEGTSGASDICYALGGSVVDNTSYCDEIPYDFPRDGKYYTTGFRCCSG